MAFNPFNAFRKHQKVLFAGLTIVCMFTFVLTSGVAGFGRDFFSELPRWLGVGRGKNPPVATVYGQKYGEMDLRLIRERRFQALRTLSGAVDVAWRTVQQPPTDQNNFSEWLKQRTKVQKLGMQYLF